MGKEENPTCDKCKEDEETPEHLLTNCLFFTKLRFQKLGIAFPQKEQVMDYNLNTILGYIKDTNRLKYEY